jgi:hypothetical protein
MRHERFALFGSPDSADLAIRALSSAGDLVGQYSVVLHRDGIGGALTDPDLGDNELGVRAGVRFGAVLGALLSGTVLGFMEIYFRAFGLGPIVGAIAGAGIGILLGGALGALVGSAYGDPNLEELAAHMKKGGVLASVNVKGIRPLRKVERVFKNHHAQLKRRAIF